MAAPSYLTKLVKGPLITTPFKRLLSTAASQQRLIVVDSNDMPIGTVTKDRAHKYYGESPSPLPYGGTAPYRGAASTDEAGSGAHMLERNTASAPRLFLGPVLHRAFSVFHFNMFNVDGKPVLHLLLTQRSKYKQTFPLMWTNACCSHPLWDYSIERGSNTGGDEETSIAAKHAAVRRLREELLMNFSVDDLKLITRMMYMARAGGEHVEYELDYVFASNRALPFLMDPSEVNNMMWVTKETLVEMLQQSDIVFTPWCRYILNKFILNSWDEMDCLDALDEVYTIDDAGIL